MTNKYKIKINNEANITTIYISWMANYTTLKYNGVNWLYIFSIYIIKDEANITIIHISNMTNKYNTNT